MKKIYEERFDIRLPRRIAGALSHAAARQQRTKSEIVREVLRRALLSKPTDDASEQQR